MVSSFVLALDLKGCRVDPAERGAGEEGFVTR